MALLDQDPVRTAWRRGGSMTGLAGLRRLVREPGHVRSPAGVAGAGRRLCRESAAVARAERPEAADGGGRPAPPTFPTAHAAVPAALCRQRTAGELAQSRLESGGEDLAGLRTGRSCCWSSRAAWRRPTSPGSTARTRASGRASPSCLCGSRDAGRAAGVGGAAGATARQPALLGTRAGSAGCSARASAMAQCSGRSPRTARWGSARRGRHPLHPAADRVAGGRCRGAGTGRDRLAAAHADAERAGGGGDGVPGPGARAVGDPVASRPGPR